MQPTFDIEALMFLSGSAYVAKRDSWFSKHPDAAAIGASYAASRDWRVHAIGVMLEGWSGHRIGCEAILADLEEHDLTTFPTEKIISPMEMFLSWHLEALASPRLRPCIEALGYEALLKRSDWPWPWRQVLVKALGGQGTATTVDALFWALEHADDDEETALAMTGLGACPRKLVLRRRRAEQSRLDELDSAILAASSGRVQIDPSTHS